MERGRYSLNIEYNNIDTPADRKMFTFYEEIGFPRVTAENV